MNGSNREKRVKIFIAGHKPAPVPAEPDYISLQVGSGQDFSPFRDNTGDNIAQKNPSFCELTALYWLWKNDESDIQGLVHYRRYFAGKPGRKDPLTRVLTGDQIREQLKTRDLILPRKRHYVIETNLSQYVHAHHGADLDATRQVLEALQPDYVPAFDRVMARRSGHRFNMIVAKREIMDAYCRWLFPILFELEKRIDITGYDAYNRRVFGFIGERLLDVWLENQDFSIQECPVMNTEGVNWILKGSRFLLRKIKGSF